MIVSPFDDHDDYNDSFPTELAGPVVGQFGSIDGLL
jgi:hypothetical protein